MCFVWLDGWMAAAANGTFRTVEPEVSLATGETVGMNVMKDSASPYIHEGRGERDILANHFFNHVYPPCLPSPHASGVFRESLQLQKRRKQRASDLKRQANSNPVVDPAGFLKADTAIIQTLSEAAG
jgi:hypothetical protein